MRDIKSFYSNKKVLVTGASGFKGAWLCSWLIRLGARVSGIGFLPNNNKRLFDSLNLKNKIKYTNIDVREFKKLSNFIKQNKPSIIFHLAAQPIVSYSYKDPLTTFDINFRGTLNLLECCRNLNYVKSIVLITSDKCYENIGKSKSYSENDKLGGVDPYSASKALAEFAIRSYRKTIYKNKNCGISSARAGNVIGGGDWSKDRLVPDAIRFILRKDLIKLRNPNFNRPWQFILEPLMGYLILGKKQYENSSKYSSAWNFGPRSENIKTVKEVVKMVIKNWGEGKIKQSNKKNFKEHQHLQLNINKAKKYLNWAPIYNIRKSITETVLWYYKVLREKENPIDVTNYQIDKYMKEFRG